MITITQKVLRFIKRHATYIVITLCGIVVLGVGVWIRPTLPQTLHTWELFRQPESLSELFFTDHLRLPTVYSPGQTYTLSFTVHNRENAAITYPYEILQQTEGTSKPSTLATGKFRLENNTTHTETATITYNDAGPRTRIIVRLPDQSQAIHYWTQRI